MRRLKRRILSHPRLVRLGIILVILISFFSLLYYFFSPVPDSSLVKTDGPVNILLLGVGDTGHDGPNLTDTMIVITASPGGALTMISIPRDIYLDSLQNKINAAYAAGGLNLAKDAAAQVTGLPINYAVKVDFSAFEKVIDLLGGIDINVPAAFDDPEYPLDGKENDPCDGDPQFQCRYETLHFDAGLQHMDGKTALKFVRSRHAPGDEGSDFARVRRQQLVIRAVRDKALTLPSLLNLKQDLAIYNELKSHIDTDFDFSRPEELLNLALKYRHAQFRSLTLDENMLVNPPEDWRGWILVPKSGSWDEIRQLIATESGQTR